MNIGKIVEKEFQDSMPSYAWCYRLRDSAGTWQGGENTRFTPSNICDFMVFANRTLHLFELKTHKGKSIPLSCIKMKNIDKMNEAVAEHRTISAHIFMNFRDCEETYCIDTSWISHYTENNPDKKSIPLSYFKEKGRFIPQAQKKVYYRYDLSGVL